MKAVYCTAFGSHQDLKILDVEPPSAPAVAEVQVAIKARGIQFSDLVKIGGNYQDQSKPPFVVGGEAAGIITALGAGVTDYAVGDAVLCFGGCVEQANVAASTLVAVPQGADLNAAASFRNNYATAYYGLQRAQLQAGETLLIHGAAGGVGLAAVDIGKLMGARVIATASSDDKLAVVGSMGADHLINYSDGFRQQVKDLTGGLGADVIYDPVGGDVFDESVRCIAPFGRILIVGFTSGRPALAKTNHLLVKDASVIGYNLGNLAKYKPKQMQVNNDTLMGWLAQGRIKPYVSHIMPMEEVVEAYQLLVDRKVIGKVILS